MSIFFLCIAGLLMFVAVTNEIKAAYSSFSSMDANALYTVWVACGLFFIAAGVWR